MLLSLLMPLPTSRAIDGTASMKAYAIDGKLNVGTEVCPVGVARQQAPLRDEAWLLLVGPQRRHDLVGDLRR
jgi:hypothetical protein